MPATQKRVALQHIGRPAAILRLSDQPEQSDIRAEVVQSALQSRLKRRGQAMLIATDAG